MHAMTKKNRLGSYLRIPYTLSISFLLFSPFSIFSEEGRADISYSREKLHILPEVFLREQDPLERIIFLHIPKTAGTNIDVIANSISQKEGKFHYQRLSVPRVSGRSPNLITSDWTGGLKQLENNPEILAQITDSFFLTGHFPYGLHLHFAKPCKYITLVRHPLERELSSVNFDYQRGYIDTHESQSYLVERMIDNPQVRMIAGVEYMKGVCTEKTLKKAKENIEQDFILAAPSEDVDSFIQILASMQKWGHLAYAPMQITGKKVIGKADSFLIDELMEKHQWDLQLYEWVKVRWKLWKDQAILMTKKLSADEKVLTVMPDYMTTHQTLLLTVFAINSYNQQHSNDGLLENQQK